MMTQATIDNLSAHDRALYERAKSITDPIFWYEVPNEDEAENTELKAYLQQHSSYLYHREEGFDI